MITLFAPDGIGEVQPGDDLVALLGTAIDAHPYGPLADGDIVVVTSKIISKAEGRRHPAGDREGAIDAESRGTVARRGPTRIVRTRHGLTLAAAGVDSSNVASDTVLLLPLDPDASAARLLAGLQARGDVALGVVVSDTAGRAWRLGQTDQAVGAAGVRVLERYDGRRDGYGNELQVTAMAIADEVASAADLVKSKLAGRPVAVVRGLGRHVLGSAAAGPSAATDVTAAALVRSGVEDMFRYGSREAVVAAALEATGQRERYEEALGQRTHEDTVELVVRGSGLSGPEAELLRRILRAAAAPAQPGPEG